MTSSDDGIEIEFKREYRPKYQELFLTVEKALQLTPYRPRLVEQAFPRRRTAFIAHAFDSAGRRHALQLIKFLCLLGFEITTGEGFSPERVSSKVKRRLLAQEIVIVVVSEKDDFTWFIQEATAADFAKKPIFLLVEDGVNFSSGVLGDLETVLFNRDHISETFFPILEGLRELGYGFA